MLGGLDIVFKKTHHSHGDYTQSKQVSKIIRDCEACLEGKRGVKQANGGLGTHRHEWSVEASLNKPSDYPSRTQNLLKWIHFC